MREITKDIPRLQSAKIVLTNRISLKSVEENKFVPLDKSLYLYKQKSELYFTQ